MPVTKTIKGDLTSHWWIVAIFIIAAIVLTYYIYTKVQADNGNNTTTTIPNTTPYVPAKQIAPAAPVTPTPQTPVGFNVASGMLPVTLQDAEQVMLDPNATAAQINEAQNIEATNNSETLSNEEGISNAPYGF